MHEPGGVTWECRARGIFRQEGMKPLVGDDVEFSVTDEGDCEGSVDKILPRWNALIRPPVANVDQALIVFALKSPDPNPGLLDRFLILMKRAGVPTVILFNKTDLTSEEDIVRMKQIYSDCGSQVLVSSTLEGQGIEEIRAVLEGKTTVVAGPSGVGKSTLTNLLCPGAQMEVGEISKKLRRGRQTTRHVQLNVVGENTYFLDTPGFSSLYLTGVLPEELRTYYPEFAPYEHTCYYPDCMHLSEPDCSVKNAVAEGRISKERYESYTQLMAEVKEEQQKRYK